jgi:hypothetical protein
MGGWNKQTRAHTHTHHTHVYISSIYLACLMYVSCLSIYLSIYLFIYVIYPSRLSIITGHNIMEGEVKGDSDDEDIEIFAIPTKLNKLRTHFPNKVPPYPNP